MENLPEIINAANSLIVTWGDQVIRQKWTDFAVGGYIVFSVFVILPTFGFVLWRFGVNKGWW